MHHDDDTAPINKLGQPIGWPVRDWSPPPTPPRQVMEGRWCRVEPIDPSRHAAELDAAFREDTQGRIWTYFGYGPFDSLASYRTWMEEECLGADPMFFAVRQKAIGEKATDGQEAPPAVGQLSYTRLDPSVGVIEVGHICYSPRLQKTAAATEAIYLMMDRVFELGYRRCEWKCDSVNEGSIRAALRLGFRPEGTFRQDRVYKGRNRDTAWFSVIDREWPALRRRLQAWLDPSNFDASGAQRQALREIDVRNA